MSIQKIAIVGASGSLGKVVLSVLSASPAVSVTVLSRASSKATFSEPTVIIPDDYSVSTLKEALRGFDGLVSTLPGSTLEPQINLASAAASAGVKRFIPADFGSVDSLDDFSTELYPDYKNKRKVRAHCENLVKQHPSFSWTTIVCGHFFDYGLINGYLGISLVNWTALIFDDGKARWSATTLARTGETVLRIFTRHAPELENRVVYAESVYTSQLDLVDAIQRLAGKTLEVTHVPSREYLEERRMQSEQGNLEIREEILTALGLTRANWKAKSTLANRYLGLDDENFDDLVKGVLESVGDNS